MLGVTGCKPDDVEVQITTQQIAEAIEGGKTMASFEARFSTIGDIDDEQKEDVERIREVVERYVSVEDFRIEKGEYQTEIIVEGEIPVLFSTVNAGVKLGHAAA